MLFPRGGCDEDDDVDEQWHEATSQQIGQSGRAMGAALWKQIRSAHGDRPLDATVVPIALTRSMSTPDKDRFEDCDFLDDREGLVTQAWVGDRFAVVAMTRVHHS